MCSLSIRRLLSETVGSNINPMNEYDYKTIHFKEYRVIKGNLKIHIDGPY